MLGVSCSSRIFILQKGAVGGERKLGADVISWLKNRVTTHTIEEQGH